MNSEGGPRQDLRMNFTNKTSAVGTWKKKYQIGGGPNTYAVKLNTSMAKMSKLHIKNSSFKLCCNFYE